MKSLLVIPAIVSLVLVPARTVALDLVRNGRPVSTIVVPDRATATERRAAETLAKYLAMASGAELPVIGESAQAGTGTILSVGRTDLAKQACITDEGLKYDGYRLAVKGPVLYLLGRDTDLLVGQQENPVMAGAQGSVRAAFGLLDRLGFRWLQPTPMGTHVPQLKTVSVADDLNITYEPP
ncbi:MAG: hypothetical protein HUU20_20770, partial [Pirellulales bacterium]|nr:hypothetical protein [Pirellulales bacterium]